LKGTQRKWCNLHLKGKWNIIINENDGELNPNISEIKKRKLIFKKTKKYMINKYNLFISIFIIVLFGQCHKYNEESIYFDYYIPEISNRDPSERWDQYMIKEAAIWKNLVVNYAYADRSAHWQETKQSLTKVIDDYPNSPWADDAAMLLVAEKSVIENNIDGAISGFREIIKRYPFRSTIIVDWRYDRGCHISEAWLMWAPSRVELNEDNSVRISFPFDRDSYISRQENEVLTYFEHLDKYPNSTKDLAQYIIALMLRQKGDMNGAISELKDIIVRYPDLSIIRKADFDASKKPYGYLIGCEPPFDAYPVWRVQYQACLMLLNLYSQQKNQVKVEEISLKLASECSPDGWYWYINRQLGNIYALHNLPQLASLQYDIAIKGIRDFAKSRGTRMQILFEEGYMIKPADFTSWEDIALNSLSNTIAEIEYLKSKLNIGG
jgi:hypothetical protein